MARGSSSKRTTFSANAALAAQRRRRWLRRLTLFSVALLVIATIALVVALA